MTQVVAHHQVVVSHLHRVVVLHPVEALRPMVVKHVHGAESHLVERITLT